MNSFIAMTYSTWKIDKDAYAVYFYSSSFVEKATWMIPRNIYTISKYSKKVYFHSNFFFFCELVVCLLHCGLQGKPRPIKRAKKKSSKRVLLFLWMNEQKKNFFFSVKFLKSFISKKKVGCSVESKLEIEKKNSMVYH